MKKMKLLLAALLLSPTFVFAANQSVDSETPGKDTPPEPILPIANRPMLASYALDQVSYAFFSVYSSGELPSDNGTGSAYARVEVERGDIDGLLDRIADRDLTFTVGDPQADTLTAQVYIRNEHGEDLFQAYNRFKLEMQKGGHWAVPKGALDMNAHLAREISIEIPGGITSARAKIRKSDGELTDRRSLEVKDGSRVVFPTWMAGNRGELTLFSFHGEKNGPPQYTNVDLESGRTIDETDRSGAGNVRTHLDDVMFRDDTDLVLKDSGVGEFNVIVKNRPKLVRLHLEGSPTLFLFGKAKASGGTERKFHSVFVRKAGDNEWRRYYRTDTDWTRDVEFEPGDYYLIFDFGDFFDRYTGGKG